MHWQSGFQIAPNWLQIEKMEIESYFFDMTSLSNVFDGFLFLLSILVTGLSFMSISSLVLELWQFPFIRDWPEIRKSEIPLFQFCPISEDWGELGIPNLAWTSLIKCYQMLQNVRVTYSLYRFLVIKGKPTERKGVKITPLPPPRLVIRVRISGKKEILRKGENWVEKDRCSQSSFQN